MPKPAFNPNAPFQPADKPKFDPNQGFQAVDEPALPPSMTPGEAFIQGAGQGLTGGYADELLGGGEAALLKGGEYLGLADKKPFIERYQEARDFYRNRAAKAAKEQPGAYYTGDVGGAIASPINKVLGPSKALGAAANIGKAAIGSGVIAAGGSNADLTKGPAELEKLGEDVATGATLGGAVQGLSTPVGYLAGKLSPSNLAQSAEQRAVKAAFGQNKKAIKDLARTGQLQKTGRDLLESDVAGGPAIGWFSKTEDILPAVKAKKAAFGEQIGDIGKKIDEAVPNAVSSDNIAKKLTESLDQIPATPKNEGVRNALQKEIDYYAAKGPMSFDEAQKLKGSYVFKPTDSTTQTLGQDVTNAARKAVSDEMENTAASIVKNPDIMPDTKAKVELYNYLKSKYGSMAAATKAGEDRALSNLSNRYTSPSDYAAGGAAGLMGAMHGGISPSTALMAAGGAAANKIARERGSAFAARSMDKLSKILAQDPAGLNRFRGALESAAKRGPQALAVTHLLLSENPEYQDTIEKAQP